MTRWIEMRILLLTQIVPYPPDAGPRVKTWHVLRYLASRGHQVTLATFVRPEEEPFLAEVRKLCHAVHAVPIRRSRAADIKYWLRSHLTGRPFLIERDDLRSMRQLVEGLVASDPIDFIHADQLGMAQFALPFASARNGATAPNASARPAPVLVFDAHNAVWTIVDRMRQNAPWYLRPPALLEARRVKRYEGQILQRFDHTLAVTEPDRLALLEAVSFAAGDNPAQAVGDAKERITIAPIAVDTRQLQPALRHPGSLNLVTLGTLHYPPNADGIRWFVEKVFPRIRQAVSGASLTIIGKNPPPDFLQWAQAEPSTFQVTGYVSDLTPYMEAAAVMVVPVRAGGGMRVRILEGFARAMPVVTTTVGLEGIQAQPGRDVLVADEEQDFAQAVVRLLRDADLQAQLASNGRRLAEAAYDWQVVLQKMDLIYSQSRSNDTPEEMGRRLSYV